MEIIGVGSKGVQIVLRTTSQMYVPYAVCHYMDAYSNKIGYTVSITNTQSAPITYDTVILEVAKSNTGANAMSVATFNSVTVPAHNEWRQQGISDILTDRGYNFCRLSYGNVTSEWIAFEDLEEEDTSI